MSDRPAVTVAIPVLDGMPTLVDVVAAVRGQRLRDGESPELLVADSGSRDGSREAIVAAGGRVIDIAPGEFSHGGTRNRLVAEAAGARVAFLTQDAVPADPRWLQALLDGFALAPRVGLVFGPYRPRPDASPMVRRELDEWFGSFAAGGEPALDPSPFFTDANGCVARDAWQQAPFRTVSYAEDQMLAADMARAGWAKAYVPAAAVVHSHEYGTGERLKRSFDEARALREVHGQGAHGGPLHLALVVQRDVRDDLALLRSEGVPRAGRARVAPRSAAHHPARALGAPLGARAARLPPRIRRALSLERRAGFDPQC